MKDIPQKNMVLLLTAAFAVAAACFGLIGYRYAVTARALTEKTQEFDAQTKELAVRTEDLARSEDDNRNLADALAREEAKIFTLEEQVRAIAGAVGDLEKLRKTDPELLKKYSKVYFLSENYIPQELLLIDAAHLYPEDEPEYIHAKALPFLTSLFSAAKSDGVELRVISAYRSFYDQKSVKSSYSFIYGAGTANQFSAEQGYSEHQLGTAVDLTTPETGNTFSKFKNTEAYAWLTKNAHRFGFILSYPEGNTYYTFEPWHWRFVGVALAEHLHATDTHFYDMSQRDIDTYLISIFDY